MNTQPNSSAIDTPEDDFLSSLRLDQNYGAGPIGVRKLLLTVPVRKPTKDEFFRTHSEHFLDCCAVELKAERETYFATPAVAQAIAEFAEPVRLRLCISRHGTVFLWPIKLPRDDRRADAWRTSAAESATLAEKRWIRIAADMNLGAYETFEAIAELGDPKWPEENFKEILMIALRQRRIDSEDHAVVRQLQGRE